MNDMKLIMESWRSYIDDENFDQNCVLYLREAKEIKKVDLDDLIKQCESGLINENRLHNIWRSSILYESYKFGTYVEAFRSLNEHMISEGLIYKSGSLTKKGKILERKEKNLDNSQFKLLTEKLEKSIEDRGLKLLLEKEEASEEDEEIAQMAAASQTGMQKAAGVLGKGLKAVGKGAWSIVSAPFKAIKWFRDKIWEGMSALFQKMWSGLKTLGEKYDIGFIKTIVATSEEIVGMVKNFCQKNKFIQIICSIVKTMVVAYLVTLAIKVMMAALGGLSGLALTAAIGGCAGGAAAGLASESRKLNEQTGAYCEMAAKSGKAAVSGTLNLIKGAIKLLAGARGEEQEVVTAALKYIDDMEQALRASFAGRLDSNVVSKDILDHVKMLADNFKGKGAALVQDAIAFVKKMVDNFPTSRRGYNPGDFNIARDRSQNAQVLKQIVDLGKAATAESNMDAFYNWLGLGEKAYQAAAEGKMEAAEKLVSKARNLLKSLGWDWETMAEVGEFSDEAEAGEGLGALADFVSK